jgi:hypothetical protein
MLPGYLSLGTSYTKIERIVPSPTKILREPMPNERCIYAAFGGNNAEKSEVLDMQYDHVPLLNGVPECCYVATKLVSIGYCQGFSWYCMETE